MDSRIHTGGEGGGVGGPKRMGETMRTRSHPMGAYGLEMGVGGSLVFSEAGTSCPGPAGFWVS